MNADEEFFWTFRKFIHEDNAFEDIGMKIGNGAM